MKRALLVAFCILALCSLFLLINTVTIKAYYDDYVTTNYITYTAPTYDGAWTTDTEWEDTTENIINASKAVFRNKYTTVGDFGDPAFRVFEHFLIEILDDDTDDAGDYWQIIYDGSADGGSVPTSDEIRFDVVGHTTAGMKVYEGDGAGGWTEISYTAEQFQMDNSIDASPVSSTPHWIAEIRVEKTQWLGGTGFTIDPWIRVAVYDASNDTAGVLAWPPTSQDVPDDYGLDQSSQTPWPEGFSLGVVVLLSSVAVAVSFYFLRKRPKTERYSSGKTGEINYTR